MSARFDDDFLLTQASLYWFTNTISTSFRPYYERHHGSSRARARRGADRLRAVSRRPRGLPPRSWVERTYNLARYTPMPHGGHFAAYEEPDLLAADITAFLRPMA